MNLLYMKTVMVFVAFGLPFILVEYFSNIYSSDIWKYALAISWSFKMIDYLTIMVNEYTLTS